MTFDKVPTRMWLLLFLGVLLAGPVAVYSFILGGPVAGAAAVVGVVFYFTVLWMIMVRRYT